jgi:tetratricopeptide (TPR) repeat protein
MPTLTDAITKAFQAVQAGNLEQSEWWCRQVLQIQADDRSSVVEHRPEILNLMGSLCHRTGRSTEAIAWYRDAITANPNYAEAYNNLGVVLHELNHLDIALAQFEAALSLNPDYAQAYFNFGNALCAEGQLQEAAIVYQKALELQPNYTAARNNLAHLQQSIGEYNSAIALYRQSIAQDPNSANAHMNLANLLQEQGNLDGAMVHYEKAIGLDPRNPNLLHNLALAFARSGDRPQAIQTHYQVLQLNSRHAESHHQLGCLLQADGLRSTEALAHLQQAINYQPDFAEAYNSIGELWHQRMELPAAIASFRQAIALDPDFADAHLNLANVLLLTGDYTRGFAAYEWRWESQTYLTAQLPRHRSILPWDGTKLDSKSILLWGEQGISATLQFVRYVESIAAMGAEIFLECDKTLVELLQKLPGVKQIIPRGEDVPKCDYQSSLISLAKTLETTLETIPKLPNLGITIGSNPQVQRVGLAVNDQCQAVLVDQLGSIDNLEIIELSEGTDYATMADTIGSLNLVIAMDNPIAHLAASLGQQTWMLLEFAPHWTWLADRTDSPWYPTVKIFRQTEAGQWDGAIGDCVQGVRR